MYLKLPHTSAVPTTSTLLNTNAYYCSKSNSPLSSMAITGTINVVYDNSRWSLYFQNKTLACWKQHLVMGQMIIHSLFLTPLRSANMFNRTIWYQCRNHYTLHTTPALTVNWHQCDNISIVIKHGFSSAGRFLLHVIYYQICNFQLLISVIEAIYCGCIQTPLWDVNL